MYVGFSLHVHWVHAVPVEARASGTGVAECWELLRGFRGTEPGLLRTSMGRMQVRAGGVLEGGKICSANLARITREIG